MLYALKSSGSTGVKAAGESGDEAELVAQAQSDPRAFAPLYARYFRPVYRYCLRSLGDEEAAADTTAQDFARALAALPRYRDGSFRSWLFAIAHNAIVDATRRRRPSAPLDAATTVPDPSASPEEQALSAEDRRSIKVLLGQLSPDQRQVVELRLAGLTGQEIADALGRSLPAVKSTQFRAYTRLRRLIAFADDGRTETTDASR
ncbi:MAG: RNA polymerase sigma factor [Thermomicrobiales bacterium]